MLLVIACQFYELDDLLGSLARQRLPEASHHTRYQRRGERSSIIIDDAAPARNHAGRTSEGHHIRLDSAIRRRSYGTEGSIHAMFVDATHREDILGIGREIDFLPGTHTIVSGRVHAYDSLVGTHRCGSGDEGGVAILLIIMMIHRGIIEAMIAERRIDDVHATAVSIFRSTCPVILLSKALGAFILASYQQILRLRSHTHIEVGRIGSHRREHHRAMFHLSKYILGFRNHEILHPRQLDIVQGRNLIHIHESAIEYGYHHPLATIATFVEPFAVQRLQLSISCAIESIALTPLVQSIAHIRAHSLTYGIGSLEHLLPLGDEFQAFQLAKLLVLMDADEQRIVPLALSYDLDTSLSHLLFVSRSHRKVGQIYRNALALTSVDGALGEEFRRAVHRKGRMVEVFILEVKTIHLAFSTRERHHIGLQKASYLAIASQQCQGGQNECIKHQISFHHLSVVRLLYYYFLV